MDEGDFAQQRAAEDLERAVAAARGIVRTLPFTGACYNCQTVVPFGAFFCDTDCRDDYEKRKRAEALR